MTCEYQQCYRRVLETTWVVDQDHSFLDWLGVYCIQGGMDDDDNNSDQRFRAALERFHAVAARRRRHFEKKQEDSSGTSDPPITAVSRLFALSENEKPWRAFAATQHSSSGQRLRIQRFVYEWSDLHVSALHSACASGDKVAVLTLLGRGCPTERGRGLVQRPRVCTLARDASGRIPLHHAVIREHHRIVRLLLHRADATLQVCVQDNAGLSSAHYTLLKLAALAHRLSPHARVARVDLRRTSTRFDRLWRTADRLVAATMVSESSDSSSSRRRRAHSLEAAEVYSSPDDTGSDSVRALDVRCRGDEWDAVRSGDRERLEFLVRVYDADRATLDHLPVLSLLQRSQLHEACDQQRLSVACYLVTQLRVPRLTQDTSGCTALHYAAMRGSIEACVLLLEDSDSEDDSDSAADTLCLCVDTRGRTALHWSAGRATAQSVATYLASKCPAALHVVDHDGFTPLHYAIWRGDDALVRAFVDLGANTNATSHGTETTAREASQVAAKTAASRLTASWAPCGARFQMRRHKTTHAGPLSLATLERSTAAVDALQDPEVARRLLARPRVSSLGHSSDSGAMDTLRYWLHRKRPELTPVPAPSSVGSSADRRREKVADCSDVLGCRKYGSVCPQCIDVATEPQLPHPLGHTRAVPPLALAIRVCSRATTALNGTDARQQIVEFLLDAGADPNDRSADDNDTPHSRSAGWQTPLGEALAVSLACPQILSVLAKYGANQIETQSLVRFCRHSWSWNDAATPTSPAVVECALLTVLRVVRIGGSSGRHAQRLLATVFATRCFNALARLVSQQASDAQAWEAVYVELSYASAETASLRARLDRDHLWFLSECLTHERRRPARPHTSMPALERLLQLCMECCFHTWRHAANCVPAVRGNEQSERERLTHACLGLLRDTTPGVATIVQWTDDCIALGLFDCALGLIDTQLRSPHVFSLDRFFRVFDRELVMNRHSLGLQPAHRKFLLAALEKLGGRHILCPTTTLSGRKHVCGSPVGVHATTESVNYACSLALPVGIVARVLALALAAPSTPSRGPCRVRGQAIAQWLAVHDQCKALTQLLLEHDQVVLRADPLACWAVRWQELVSAVAASIERQQQQQQQPQNSHAATELLDWLLAMYPTLAAREERPPTHDDSVDTELRVLEWLLLERAVRCDSVLVFRTVVQPLWSSHIARVCGATGAADRQPQREPRAASTSLATVLLETNFFFHAARWNARKLSAYVVNEIFTVDADDTLSWRDTLTVNTTSSGDSSSALALCYELGHVELAELFLSAVYRPDSSSTTTVSSVADATLLEKPTHGLFRTVLRLHNRLRTPLAASTPVHPTPIIGKALRALERLGHCKDERSRVFSWEAASALNLVPHLDALRLHRVPIANVAALATLAVDCGAFDALYWLLDYAARCPATRSALVAAHVGLVAAASRHTTEVYARATLRLLDAAPYTGRVAGDGTDTTVLHRCACFANVTLVEQTLAKALAVPGSSIDVLDGDGNAPVVYAFLSGHLAAVCALVSKQELACRLEAEFEGQSCFYYILQLAPSFAWRWVLQKVLVEKCGRQFLHCDSGCVGNGERQHSDSQATVCGCKGFERPADALTTDQRDDAVCSFCGHAAAQHTRVPFPPWFMDQYETYVGVRADRTSSDCDRDNSEWEVNVGDDVNKLVVEDQRGRLGVSALAAVAAVKYANIAASFGLSALDPLDVVVPTTTNDECPVASEQDDSSGGRQGWTMFPLRCLDSDCDSTETSCPGMVESRNDDDSDSDGSSLNEPGLDNDELPWGLRKELDAAHPPSCRCQRFTDLVTSDAMWKHQLVSQWLWVSASRRRASSSRLSSSHPHSTPLHAVASPTWQLRLTLARWHTRTRAVATAHQIRLSDDQRDSVVVRKLQQFLSHWQFARAFAAFQRWKHVRESNSEQHERLATALDAIVAHMRRSRLAVLREKHSTLERRRLVTTDTHLS